MSNFLIVRINDKLIPEFLIKFNSTDNTAQNSNVSSWNDIKQEPKDKLIVLLSANLVLTSQVKIPSKNDEIIRQSIPFTIEEEIATDIELNHFAYKKDNSQSQELMVSVVNKNLLQNILTNLENQNLICSAMYSEIFSCPHKKGMTTMCAFDDYIIIRGDTNGTTIHPKLISPVSYTHLTLPTICSV